MADDRLARAAALLLEARDTGRPLPDFPAECRPRSEEESYAIQELVARRRGPIVAWKTGAAGPDGPASFAPIFALTPSPARFPASGQRLFGIEAEVAFRLTHALPPRARPYERDEVVAAIGDAHLAIELLESRFVDRERVDGLAKLADNLTNGALIVGPAIANWATRGLDFARLPVTLRIDDARVAETGGNTGGDPLRLVVALANYQTRRDGLPAGTVITTGSLTGMNFARAGASVVADFGALGEVRLSFPA